MVTQAGGRLQGAGTQIPPAPCLKAPTLLSGLILGSKDRLWAESIPLAARRHWGCGIPTPRCGAAPHSLCHRQGALLTLVPLVW